MFNCSFMWIKRTCNAAAHVTARFALLSSPLLCFSKDSVPEVIMSVCKRDYPLYSLGFSFISLQLIKKKKLDQSSWKNLFVLVLISKLK